MKTTLATLCALFLLGTAAAANDPVKTTGQAVDKGDTIREYMTPGKMHKMLALLNGKWNSEATLYPEPGTAEPFSFTNNVENTMILGGRYQQSKYSGEFIGMPYEGIGTLGYDNSSKKFVSSWVDNIGTGMIYLEGLWDAAEKTITLTGEITDPITRKKNRVKEIIRLIDHNTYLIEMYSSSEGEKEHKYSVNKLTRQK